MRGPFEKKKQRSNKAGKRTYGPCKLQGNAKTVKQKERLAAEGEERESSSEELQEVQSTGLQSGLLRGRGLRLAPDGHQHVQVVPADVQERPDAVDGEVLNLAADAHHREPKERNQAQAEEVPAFRGVRRAATILQGRQIQGVLNPAGPVRALHGRPAAEPVVGRKRPHVGYEPELAGHLGQIPQIQPDQGRQKKEGDVEGHDQVGHLLRGQVSKHLDVSGLSAGLRRHLDGAIAEPLGRRGDAHLVDGPERDDPDVDPLCRGNDVAADAQVGEVQERRRRPHGGEQHGYDGEQDRAPLPPDAALLSREGDVRSEQHAQVVQPEERLRQLRMQRVVAHARHGRVALAHSRHPGQAENSPPGHAE
eukprot:scaffold171_cov263-Pinguiococcus_pyrenoidosus.AAC.7